MAQLIVDVETYPNFFLVGFKRISDGKYVHLELSDRAQCDRARLARIMRDNQTIGFNSLGYDLPMIYGAIEGASVSRLKLINDQIIKGGLKPWHIQGALGINVPRNIDHIDLIEVQPNAVASLKTLNGRLHGPKMQDLPYGPDYVLNPTEMDAVIRYNCNDLDATERLFNALEEPIALRVALGREMRMDFRSKSDSQMGEALIKRRVEDQIQARIERVEMPAGTTFKYDVPDFIKFETPELQEILEQIRKEQFFVRSDSKVELPAFLSKRKIKIGSSTYAMGIGGLHSTEAHRSLYSDDERVLIDADVASQYPSIILKLGLYPKAMGPAFLKAYADLKAERLIAKKAKDKVKDKGFKIALNGCYGKLGSKFSVLFAPHLMIAVTLTGQLTLLMLIERAEAAGISVVSGNTDGVLFYAPRDLAGELDGDRFAPGSKLHEITSQWERETGFDLEFLEYQSMHNSSVNTYVAVKPDGSTKRKGYLMNPNPWSKTADIREQLMKNPEMTICTDAVVEYLVNGTPIEETIRSCEDVRQFLTVVKATGGGTWRDKYLGKVVRFIWSTDGDPILYANPDPRTGNHKKVSKSEGCRPIMDLPEWFPDDIDYDRYIAEAQEILVDIGAVAAPPPPPKISIRGRHQAPRNLLIWSLVD